MARLLKTVERQHVVETANRMIEHLSASGTREDQVRREAIIALTSSILLKASDNERSTAYAGFRYLDKPLVTYTADGSARTSYDETRVSFY